MDQMSFREFPEVQLKGNIGLATFPEDGIDKNAIMLSLEQDLKVPLEEKLPAGFGIKSVQAFNEVETEE